MTIPVSVIILTKNEEINIKKCLESVAWCDDVHLYDSYSADKTVEIAQEMGAVVTQRKFDNWSSHQNWGLQNLKFKYDWVLYIDADERVTDGLKDAVESAVKNPGKNIAFRVERRDFFQGTWIKHVQASAYYMRLFRPEKMRYERLVNPVSIPDGPVGELNGHLIHYPFSKGLAEWFEKHNSYSSFEADQILEDRKNKKPFSLFKVFFCKDFNERRYHQKELYYRLPFRFLIMFILMYFVRRGFLDGKAGFRYALMRGMYELMIELKTKVK